MRNFVLLLLVIGIACCIQPKETEKNGVFYDKDKIKLPEPSYDGKSLEKTIAERRSIRVYSDEALTLKELSQLLWSAQGITDPRGFRTAPSAGALYPLEIFVVIGRVEGIQPGVYRYSPKGHEMLKVAEGDKREELSKASLNQECIRNAAIDIVITAVYERTTNKYGERGIRYVHIEVGHVAQNVLLQATSLDLGAVPVGAFNDAEVKRILELSVEEPLYIIAVGKKV